MIGNTVRVMRIATREENDTVINDCKDPAARALGAKGGKKRARATPSGKPGFFKTLFRTAFPSDQPELFPEYDPGDKPKMIKAA